MKRTVKVIVIIGGILLLGKLFVIPLKNPFFLSDNMEDAKRDGAFVNECRVISIDTLLSGYNFPVDKAWTQKYLNLGRNKFGIVKPVIFLPDRTLIRFSLTKRDTFFTMNNVHEKWAIIDEAGSFVEDIYGLLGAKFNYTSKDTACYVAYKIKDETVSVLDNKYGKENLIPLFRFKVVAIKE